MGIDLDYMGIGVVIGILVYWVGYGMGHKAGMRDGTMLSQDPNARQWWR